MKIRENVLSQITFDYPIEKITNPERILFVDIETTGFTARTAALYMIGCAYVKEGKYHFIQWFAENRLEEKELLNCFLEFSAGFTYLIHFNGNNFDLPFLIEKCKQHHLVFHLECFDGLDIYRRIAPLKAFLKLPNCKQKSIEHFLSIDREDQFSGGELIEVYHNYLKQPSSAAYDILSLHNEEDVEGMLLILPILSYVDLLSEPIKIVKAQGNYYHDYYGNPKQELILSLEFITPLPVQISYANHGCYFTGSGFTGTLKVPLYQEELKYFYENYKDYYYLPSEDTALHKSVATFVDTAHRKQATASTCYTRKESLFLEQWGNLFLPVFKRDYLDKSVFFELTDSMKTDREAFGLYANHVLGHMVNLK